MNNIFETTRRQKAIKNFLGMGKNIKTFCIVASENPMGKKLNSLENDARIKKMEDYLKEIQQPYFKAKGKYKDVEHPFIVFNISLNDSMFLAHGIGFFKDIEGASNINNDQESFIFGECNMDENNQPVVSFSYYLKDYGDDAEAKEDGTKLTKKDKEYKFVEQISEYRNQYEQDDCFTAIGKHFKFSIPFKIFESQFGEFNDMLEERSKSLSYFVMKERLINECISDDYTGKSKRLKRARLYGDNYKSFLQS